jgi:uncharacterized coiled-coil DUF342 family protein
MPKNNPKIAQLLNQIDWLSDVQKQDWELIFPYLSTAQQKEAVQQFNKCSQELDKIRENTVNYSELEEKYRLKIKELTQKFKKLCSGKEEAFKAKKEANPEEILQKLADINDDNNLDDKLNNI